jgi:hypothetical protein
VCEWAGEARERYRDLVGVPALGKRAFVRGRMWVFVSRERGNREGGCNILLERSNKRGGREGGGIKSGYKGTLQGFLYLV